MSLTLHAYSSAPPSPSPMAWLRRLTACLVHGQRRLRRAPGDEALDRIHVPLRAARGCVPARFLAAGDGEAAVVLVPPGRGVAQRTPRLIDELRRLGFSVLVLERPGRDGPPLDAAALLGAVDYLLERGCAAGRIGVLGASAGAAAALNAATQDAAIGAVIADSARVEPGVISLAARPRHAPRRGSWGRLLAAFGSAPGADVGRLRGRPVLVIHGDNDPVVPVAHGLALAQATQSRLWVTASRSHAGSLRDDPGTYCAVVLRFFTHHLLGDGVPLACDRGPGLAPRPGAGPLF